MGRKSTKCVLYEPFSGDYTVIGHKGKVIPFRHPRGFYPKNIAELFAAMHAASGININGGHAVFCHSCSAQEDVEAIAKSGGACGWKWSGSDRGYWTCPNCDLLQRERYYAR